jgi:hypothetical protein
MVGAPLYASESEKSAVTTLRWVSWKTGILVALLAHEAVCFVAEVIVVKSDAGHGSTVGDVALGAGPSGERHCRDADEFSDRVR